MELLFSVIVPIYKVEKYLPDCVNSILNQTYKDFELLLVDDGSPDNCPQMCDDFALKDSRIRVIHKKNGGLVSARNIGIKNAKGKYICYVDGDDTVDEKLLESIYKEILIKNNPDIIIFGIVKNFADHDEEIFCDLPDGLYDKKAMEEKVYPYMMYDNRKSFYKGLIFPAACNKIYSRKLLLEHYCRDDRIRMGEDNAFVYECVWNSNSIYIYNKIFYYYNQLNPSAMNQSYDPNRFKNNKYLFDYMGSRLKGKNSVLDLQFEAFKAYWLIMAVFHEVKCGRTIHNAAVHIRQQIKDNNTMKYITTKGLPKSALIFVVLLKLKMYHIALFGASIMQKIRRKGK